METTIVYWGYIGIMEKRMETTIVYWNSLERFPETLIACENCRLSIDTSNKFHMSALVRTCNGFDLCYQVTQVNELRGTTCLCSALTQGLRGMTYIQCNVPDCTLKLSAWTELIRWCDTRPRRVPGRGLPGEYPDLRLLQTSCTSITFWSSM